LQKKRAPDRRPASDRAINEVRDAPAPVPLGFVGLPADYRAALWLYAWSLQSAAHQRYEALGFLAELESAKQTD
jgi:hypothetical protein